MAIGQKGRRRLGFPGGQPGDFPRGFGAGAGEAILTAKTPQMVRKDIWARLLGYNLLRSLMEYAAPLADDARSQISLQGARQHFNLMLALLTTATRATRKRLYTHLLETIATDLLPARPNQREPRVIKRRPQPFPRMRQPRSVLKAKLAA